jgi:isoamyl acetate esterase
MADILWQLQNLTFDRLGLLWCGDDSDAAPNVVAADSDASSSALRPQTSLEWFHNFRQQQNRLAFKAHPDDPQ